MGDKGERWAKPPEGDCCTQALRYLAHPMETKLVRCDERPYREPAKPGRIHYSEAWRQTKPRPVATGTRMTDGQNSRRRA
eukprot:351874-Chlamydomonas_euryale.AAC.1